MLLDQKYSGGQLLNQAAVMVAESHMPERDMAAGINGGDKDLKDDTQNPSKKPFAKHPTSQS